MKSFVGGEVAGDIPNLEAVPVTMPTKLSPLAIRLAGDPTEPHWQLAFFDGSVGMRRTAQYSDQRDAQSGIDKQHPTPDFRPRNASIGWSISTRYIRPASTD